MRTGRLTSVDAFRGLAILAMILVNNPGNWSTVYWPLLHAEWHGCTPTDLIFPFFLFIVGVSIVLAYQPRIDRGFLPSRALTKILKRSAILFGLGLFLSGFPFGLFGPRNFSELLASWRIPGVLQRIAICYLVVSLLFLYGRRRLLVSWTVASLLGYWALISLVPAPGSGPPNLDSRGDHLAGWLDRTVFGNHLWVSAKVYDPEGLLSTLPAIATTLLGVWAGRLLLSKGGPVERTARLFVHGWVLVIVGYVWGWFLPLNKALWTSSYAVFTAGLAFNFLALCHWRFDVQGDERLARPLVVFGVNAISVFVGSGLLGRALVYVRVGDDSLKGWIYDRAFLSWLPAYPASLAYALTWVAGWYLVLLWLDRREIVIKV